ncbi:hypothetical protein AN641_00115 [Candidatus Epulonipiscioides gigas]|nr:hypothetical protein AN641_00115 [Epulopiscium sp. SCG-C07WGA-EpuloA2]
MKFCYKCGNEIDSEAVICPKCGVQQPNKALIVDDGHIGWGVLGFCIPIVGLILFLVWKDQKPRNAKKAIIGALFSVILLAVCILDIFSSELKTFFITLF